MTAIPHTLIYRRQIGRPMNVVVFASGGGGNLLAAIRASLAQPELLKIGLVVTDRLHIPAIDIARSHGIAVLAYDFEKQCGSWVQAKKDPASAVRYRRLAERFHDQVLDDILVVERQNRLPFDLAVLSYHRWIHGRLLDYFDQRMINQHAGDLTVMSTENPLVRRYIGIDPVLMALRAGDQRTRTCTFLVRSAHDGGEIISRGPWVDYAGGYPVTKERSWQHELAQKEHSDWPSLTFALTAIAKGEIGVTDRHHPDGCKILTYKGKALPYGGVDLDA